MRPFRSVVVVVLFATVIFFGRGVPAHVCSCAAATYDQHFANVDAVFDGITQGFVGNEVASTYEFKVMETFKGSVSDPAFVRTPKNSAACGDTFDKDVAYRLFVKKEDGGLTTNLCMGNIKSTDAPKITTTTSPKPATTKPIAATTTTEPPTTTSSSTTSTTSGDEAVTLTQSDGGGGRGWVLPAALGGVALAGAIGFGLYQRSRRTDPAL